MQELLFAPFLSREECSLCIVAHHVQKYARIAADFGLRSFKVLGFGRATRLVSAMPVLILRLGAECVGALVLGLVQPFGVVFFARVRTPCGRCAQVIVVRGKETRYDDGE